MAMPGKVQWLTVSLSSERLRSRRNVPTNPPAAPSAVTPANTTRVL